MGQRYAAGVCVLCLHCGFVFNMDIDVFLGVQPYSDRNTTSGLMMYTEAELFAVVKAIMMQGLQVNRCVTVLCLCWCVVSCVGAVARCCCC